MCFSWSCTGCPLETGRPLLARNMFLNMTFWLIVPGYFVDFFSLIRLVGYGADQPLTYDLLVLALVPPFYFVSGCLLAFLIQYGECLALLPRGLLDSWWPVSGWLALSTCFLLCLTVDCHFCLSVDDCLTSLLIPVVNSRGVTFSIRGWVQ